VLPKWRAWSGQAGKNSALTQATYPFPEIDSKFLGTVVQKYRVRREQTASAAFQQWIDEIQAGVEGKLIPALEGSSMLIESEIYDKLSLSPSQPIMQLSDFNGLIARSQACQVPVFALSDEQLEQTGIVLARTKKSMEKFRETFSEGADKIIGLVDNAVGN